MQVVFSQFVESDLEEIGDYIAADNPLRAVTFLREICAALERIGTNPPLYRLRPDVGEDARLAAVGRYVILFSVDAEQVRVERVVHGSRLLHTLYL